MTTLYDLSARLDDAAKRNPVIQLHRLKTLVSSPPCLCLDCHEFKSYLELLDAEVFHIQLHTRQACSDRFTKEHPPKPAAPKPPSKPSRISTTTDDLMTGLDI